MPYTMRHGIRGGINRNTNRHRTKCWAIPQASRCATEALGVDGSRLNSACGTASEDVLLHETARSWTRILGRPTVHGGLNNVMIYRQGLRTGASTCRATSLCSCFYLGLSYPGPPDAPFRHARAAGGLPRLASHFHRARPSRGPASAGPEAVPMLASSGRLPRPLVHSVAAASTTPAARKAVLLVQRTSTLCIRSM